jgi:hypothetical protein
MSRLGVAEGAHQGGALQVGAFQLTFSKVAGLAWRSLCVLPSA